MAAIHNQLSAIFVFIKTHANDTKLWQSEHTLHTPGRPFYNLIFCCLCGRHNWIGDSGLFFQLSSIKSGDPCFIHEMHNEAPPPCHILRYDVNAHDARNSGISVGLTRLYERLHQHFYYFCHSSSKTYKLNQVFWRCWRVRGMLLRTMQRVV